MGARQQLAQRLAPQHVIAGVGEQLVGRVRLAALELLDSKRTAKPIDVVAHPSFEAGERQIVLFRGRHLAPPPGRRLPSIVYDGERAVSCPQPSRERTR